MGANPACSAKQLKRPLLGDCIRNSNGSPVVDSPASATTGTVQLLVFGKKKTGKREA